MYEPQLSDFVRFWCIFCIVSFTRWVRIARGRFRYAACNSVNRICSTSTLFYVVYFVMDACLLIVVFVFVFQY